MHDAPAIHPPRLRRSLVGTPAQPWPTHAHGRLPGGPPPLCTRVVDCMAVFLPCCCSQGRREDLRSVVEHLRKRFNVQYIYCWHGGQRGGTAQRGGGCPQRRACRGQRLRLVAGRWRAVRSWSADTPAPHPPPLCRPARPVCLLERRVAQRPRCRQVPAAPVLPQAHTRPVGDRAQVGRGRCPEAALCPGGSACRALILSCTAAQQSCPAPRLPSTLLMPHASLRAGPVLRRPNCRALPPAPSWQHRVEPRHPGGRGGAAPPRPALSRHALLPGRRRCAPLPRPRALPVSGVWPLRSNNTAR